MHYYGFVPDNNTMNDCAIVYNCLSSSDPLLVQKQKLIEIEGLQIRETSLYLDFDKHYNANLKTLSYSRLIVYNGNIRNIEMVIYKGCLFI